MVLGLNLCCYTCNLIMVSFLNLTAFSIVSPFRLSTMCCRNLQKHTLKSHLPFTFFFQTNDTMLPKEEIALPDGWKWDQDWNVDMNRGCDDEGW